MRRLPDRLQRVESVCIRDDLATYDPYDIWKTALGFRVKDFYNHHRLLGTPAAAAVTLFDTYINNDRRWSYRRQEYPIVRAQAALAMLNLHERHPQAHVLRAVRRHLDWLLAHASPGYSGPCWGIGFRQPISAGIEYDAELPLTTMTPYALEAFVRYHAIASDDSVLPVIRAIHAFFDRDVPVIEETPEYEVTAYSAKRDRRVVNAVSYVMYALALALPSLGPGEQQRSRARIGKLYRYLELVQRDDGSWLYSPDGPPFVDCFHSCFVLKNVFKTDRLLGLPHAGALLDRGWAYLLRNFRDDRTGLFRRFAVANKPSLVRFDLYDNAEVIHLATLMGDPNLAHATAQAVEQHFCRADDVYSQIDSFGRRHNRNTLRWAVMPWLYALSGLGD